MSCAGVWNCSSCNQGSTTATNHRSMVGGALGGACGVVRLGCSNSRRRGGKCAPERRADCPVRRCHSPPCLPRFGAREAWSVACGGRPRCRFDDSDAPGGRCPPGGSNAGAGDWRWPTTRRVSAAPCVSCLGARGTHPVHAGRPPAGAFRPPGLAVDQLRFLEPIRHDHPRAASRPVHFSGASPLRAVRARSGLVSRWIVASSRVARQRLDHGAADERHDRSTCRLPGAVAVLTVFNPRPHGRAPALDSGAPRILWLLLLLGRSLLSSRVGGLACPGRGRMRVVRRRIAKACLDCRNRPAGYARLSGLRVRSLSRHPGSGTATRTDLPSLSRLDGPFR